MSKKLYAAFVPLAAVLAFVAMPAAAQAAPHWFSCEAGTGFEDNVCTKASATGKFEWVKIKEGEPQKVKTEGALELHAKGVIISCKVKDKGTIENPTGGGAGVNSITEFANSECKSSNIELCPEPATIEVFRKTKKLSATNAWPSTLIEVGGVIRDEIREIEVEPRCNGTIVGLFTGSLMPKIGSSAAEFEAGSGEIKTSSGSPATVTGVDKLVGPAGDVGITAK